VVENWIDDNSKKSVITKRETLSNDVFHPQEPEERSIFDDIDV
jgi:hypothetical protein